MNWRTTAGLFLLMLLLAGIAYWQWERRLPATPTPQSTLPFMVESTPLIPEVAPDDVLRLEIARGVSGGQVTFVQEEGQWTATSAEASSVLSQTVATALQSLLEEGSRRTLPPSANPPAVYGLDSPAASIVVAARRGERSVRHTLFVGNLTPAEDAYYLQKAGDPRIYVVPTFPINNILELLEAATGDDGP